MFSKRFLKRMEENLNEAEIKTCIKSKPLQKELLSNKQSIKRCIALAADEPQGSTI